VERINAIKEKIVKRQTGKKQILDLDVKVVKVRTMIQDTINHIPKNSLQAHV
jgi:hypothetical protein